jgi:hypothetical protein
MTQFRQFSSMPQEKQGHQQNEDEKPRSGGKCAKPGPAA